MTHFNINMAGLFGAHIRPSDVRSRIHKLSRRYFEGKLTYTKYQKYI